MLAAVKGDLFQFYKACRELAKKAQAERNEILAAYANSN
jgi:hypothetical protein